jgi:hypothetical protein
MVIACIRESDAAMRREDRGKNMTQIHAQVVGTYTLLPRGEFERLLELARRSEAVDLQWREEDLPAPGIMRLAEQGGAFAFWGEDGEDIYTTQDGEPI